MKVWRITGLCALTVACALGGNPAKKALEVAEDYGLNLQWRRYPEAIALVHPERRPEFGRMIPLTEGRLRFTSYEIDAIRVSPEEGTAEASVRYGLVSFPALIEEQRQEVLRLRREHGEWYVEPDLSVLERDLGLTAWP